MIGSDAWNILFGKWIYSRPYINLRNDIRQAHISRNVHEYVCSSLFYALITGLLFLIAGFVLSRYLIHSSIAVLLITVISGTTAGYLTYIMLISYPSIAAKNRRYRIELSMAHAVTYLYALSKGGANILDMFRSLSLYTHIYRGTADEIALIVRDIEYFGMDVVTALTEASKRTPSKKFKDFLDNLVSVINSGGDLTGFFKIRSEFYQETAAEDQKFFLETLGIFAEVYVSVLVAGPLFLIVIMVVMGLLRGGIELYLSIVIYALIPIGTLLYIVLVDTISGTREEMPIIYTKVKRLDRYRDIPQLQAGENEIRNIKEFEQYEKQSKIISRILHPLQIFVESPARTFIVAVPAASIFLLFRLKNNTLISGITDQLLIALLLIIIPYTIFFEMRTHRIRKLEERMPEFLTQLAGMNEAGLTLTQSIAHTAESDLGILTYEIKKIHQAIEWGTITIDALLKFEKRIKSGAISRVITLIIKASEATSDIRHVLSIAAKDADIAHRLKQERLASLSIYVMIIYLSFSVFLFIIVVLLVYFLAKMPSTGEVSMFKTSGISNLRNLFYHAALLQGLFSGFVAGQMGEGNPRAGLKHSVLMLIITFIVFTYFLRGVG